MTVNARVRLPAQRGRQTQAAIDAVAGLLIARKGILTPAISDITAEPGTFCRTVYHRGPS